MENSIKVGLALLVLFVLGAGGTLFLRNKNENQVHPKRGPLVEAIYALGKVKSNRQFEVKIGVLENVQTLWVKEGDFVEKSQKLVKFAETAYFVAPFSGTITYLAVDEGETASPQTPLLRMEDLNDKYIEVSLEQSGALRVKKGQKTNVVFETLRGDKLSGIVETLFPKNDEFLAHIKVDGLKPNVLPGMTADVAILVGEKQDALLVPLNAVDNGKVMRIRENHREKVDVKIGGVDGQWAEVLEGDLLPSDFVQLPKEK